MDKVTELAAAGRNVALLQGDLGRYGDALRQCRDQFAFYAREHEAAGKHEKAATNRRFAEIATDALEYEPPKVATPASDSEKLREAYLVWSNEHQAWWGKDRCGYTRFIDRAGRYDRAEALSIAGTRDGGWHVRKGNPDEIAIPERDAINQYASITQSQRDDAAALGASL